MNGQNDKAEYISTYLHTHIHTYLYIQYIYMYVCVCACLCMIIHVYVYSLWNKINLRRVSETTKIKSSGNKAAIVLVCDRLARENRIPTNLVCQIATEWIPVFYDMCLHDKH